MEDAKVLLSTKRFAGASYMSGYAIEIALKARVCRTLGWKEFPMTQREFQGLGSFRTHDLDLLLRLSGQESVIKQNHFVDWSAVAAWNPEARYRPIDEVTESEAGELVSAVDALVKVI